MTSKKSAALTVPVVKHCQLTVRGKLKGRMQRDLLDDLSAKVAQGFKVYTMAKTGDGVVLQMGKAEDWTLDELVEAIDDLQEES